MAKAVTREALSPEEEKKRLQGEKKQLKKQRRDQKKEVRRRAKEIAREEEELGLDEGNGLVTFGATVLIVALWIAIVGVIVKLDVGGFGSSVLAPILKDVPVVNKILPNAAQTTLPSPEGYGGYTSLEEAVNYIRQLELELDQARTEAGSRDADLEKLYAEITRLREFEAMQVEFQRIRQEFYEEVVYAEKGPGAEEYKKWYEEMDPATAEAIYRQEMIRTEESKEIQNYAAIYSAMKPKEAAAIFDTMTNDLTLVAKILNAMETDTKGKILAAMNADTAAKLTKILDPNP